MSPMRPPSFASQGPSLAPDVAAPPMPPGGPALPPGLMPPAQPPMGGGSMGIADLIEMLLASGPEGAAALQQLMSQGGMGGGMPGMMPGMGMEEMSEPGESPLAMALRGAGAGRGMGGLGSASAGGGGGY